MRTPRIAGSVLIASLALALSIGSVVLIYLHSQDVTIGEDAVGYLGLGICGSPLIALLNVVLIVRDLHNGRRDAAVLAMMLSLSVAVVAVCLIMVAD